MSGTSDNNCIALAVILSSLNETIYSQVLFNHTDNSETAQYQLHIVPSLSPPLSPSLAPPPPSLFL